MPNPMKKFFRRPAVKRVKKIASRQYRKIFPEQGSYDVAKYRALSGLAPDWLIQQVHAEEAAYKHGFDQPRYVQARHSFEYPQLEPPPRRGYRSYEGRLPAYDEPMLSQPDSTYLSSQYYDDSTARSLGMSDLSQMLQSGPCSPQPRQPARPPAAIVCSSPMETTDQSISMSNLSQGLDTSGQSSSHREMMLMLDQLETAEWEKIQKDLREYQTWRRRLMFDVAALSATSAPPAALLKPATGAGPPGRRPAIAPP